MNNSNFWYRLWKPYIALGVFFYTKKIRVVGKHNIPKEGAVLFAVNHPNGLIDPLIVATHNFRICYFLVKAAVFKKPIIEKILNAIHLIPIYRMRDGINQLARNQEVFNTCFEILKQEKTLMIFPEGSDCKDRKVRPLSKGFTRIVFGALEKYPEIKLKVVPVGITYQQTTAFPSKVALHYGTAIDANKILAENNTSKAITILKKEVTEQLETLSVHIPDANNYEAIVEKLNRAQVDFTNVNEVNEMIKTQRFPSAKKAPLNWLKPWYYLLILNSLTPYFIWNYLSRKNKDKDFTASLRYSYNIFLFPFFYLVQAVVVTAFLGQKAGLIYLVSSLLLVLIYSKLSTTPPK